MHIWIDAKPAEHPLHLFGLTGLERILRSITKTCDNSTVVVVSGLITVETDTRYSLVDDTGTAIERLSAYITRVDGPVLALEVSTILDARLIPQLMQNSYPSCFMGNADNTDSAILCLTPSTLPPTNAVSLHDAAKSMLQNATIKEVKANQLSDFVGHLRRNVPFTLERVFNEQQSTDLEKRLFQLSYKGSTDFMTKWVYPPIVWKLTHLCIKWNLTPNIVTVFSILLTIIAIPLFFYGYWILGFAAAFSMTILDSVDGKLARLTLTDSPVGNFLDHGLDIIHPPFWYWAWAAGLVADGSTTSVYIAATWLIFFYIADRLTLMVAKTRFKRGLHAVTPLDGMVRTWIARRNVNLVIFTIGVIFGIGAYAFLFITIWQAITFIWHTYRTAWLYPKWRHKQYFT
jgi:phosphatidylglycerophosphate synthase